MLELVFSEVLIVEVPGSDEKGNIIQSKSLIISCCTGVFTGSETKEKAIHIRFATALLSGQHDNGRHR